MKLNSDHPVVKAAQEELGDILSALKDAQMNTQHMRKRLQGQEELLADMEASKAAIEAWLADQGVSVQLNGGS